MSQLDQVFQEGRIKLEAFNKIIQVKNMNEYLILQSENKIMTNSHG